MDQKLLQEWNFYGSLFREILGYLGISLWNETSFHEEFGTYPTPRQLEEAQWQQVSEVFSSSSQLRLECIDLSLQDIRSFEEIDDTQTSIPFSPIRRYWIIRGNNEGYISGYYLAVHSFEIAELTRYLVIPVLTPPDEFLITPSENSLCISDLEMIRHRIILAMTTSEDFFGFKYPMSAFELLQKNPKVFIRDQSLLDQYDPVHANNFLIEDDEVSPRRHSEQFYSLLWKFATMPYSGYYFPEYDDYLADPQPFEIELLQIYALHTNTIPGRAALITLLSLQAPTAEFLNYLYVVLKFTRYTSEEITNAPLFNYLPIRENYYLLFIYEYLRMTRNNSVDEDDIADFMSSYLEDPPNDSPSFSLRENALLGFFEQYCPASNIRMKEFFANLAEHIFGTETSLKAYTKYDMSADAFILYSHFYPLNDQYAIDYTMNKQMVLRSKEVFDEVLLNIFERKPFLPSHCRFAIHIIIANSWPIENFLFEYLYSQKETFFRYLLIYSRDLLPKLSDDIMRISFLTVLSTLNSFDEDTKRSFNGFKMVFLNNCSDGMLQKLLEKSEDNPDSQKIHDFIISAIKDQTLYFEFGGRAILNKSRCLQQLSRFGIHRPSNSFDLKYQTPLCRRIDITEQTSPESSGDQIGAGGFGTAFLVGNEVVKRMSRTADDDIRHSYFKELDRAGKFRLNPFTTNIIQTVGYNSDLQDIYMVAGQRNLYGVGSPQKSEEQQVDRRRLVYEMLRGIHSCHQNGIYHLDVKNSNVVLVQEEDTMRADLIDFGLSTFTGNISESSYQNDIKFASTYRPPEVDMPGDSVPYDYGAADIWASAVTMWILLNSKSNHPYLPTFIIEGRQYCYFPRMNGTFLFEDGSNEYNQTAIISFFVSMAFRVDSFDIYKYRRLVKIQDSYSIGRVKSNDPSSWNRYISALNWDIESQFPPLAYPLLRKMLSVKFWERPSIEEVLRDDFFIDLASDTQVVRGGDLRNDIYWRLGGMYQYLALESTTKYIEEKLEHQVVANPISLDDWKHQIDILLQENDLVLPSGLSRSKQERNYLVENFYPSRKILVTKDPDDIDNNMIFDDFSWFQFLYVYSNTKLSLRYDDEILVFLYAYFEAHGFYSKNLISSYGGLFQFVKFSPHTLALPQFSSRNLSFEDLRQKVDKYQKKMSEDCKTVYSYISPLDILSEKMPRYVFDGYYDNIIDYLNKLFIEGIFEKYNSAFIAMVIFYHIADEYYNRQIIDSNIYKDQEMISEKHIESMNDIRQYLWEE